MKIYPVSEYALLGSIINGATYGYEIQRFLKECLGSIWRIPTSQLYALLKKMEDRGLVRSKVELQDDRPSKRVFHATENGVAAFNKWLITPCKRVRDIRIEFLAKLYFIKSSGVEGSGLVKAQAGMLEKTVSGITSWINQDISPYDRLAAEFKLAMAEACLNWLLYKVPEFLETGDAEKS